jgi:hypothetical protein
MMEAGFIPGNLGAFKKEGGKIRLYDSGPSTPSSTTNTNLTYPKELQPMIMSMADKALATTNKDYIKYDPTNPNTFATFGESRVAGFTDPQKTAQYLASNLQPSQQLGTAAQFATNAGLKGGAVNYTPQQFGTASFTQPGVAGMYMSPYAQNVIDIQNREADRQAQIANQQLQSGAVKSGAYGGSRQAIMEAEAARNLALQKGDIQQRGQQAAYEQAQNLYGQEAQRQIAAQQAMEQSRQYGAGLGLQGLQSQLQAAGQLGSIGQEQMQQQQAIINAMQNVGQQQQALEQAKMSEKYQDYLSAKQHPYQQLAFLKEMIAGTPQNTSQSVYQSPQSTSAMLASAVPILYGANKLFAGGGLMSLGVHNLSRG